MWGYFRPGGVIDDRARRRRARPARRRGSSTTTTPATAGLHDAVHVVANQREQFSRDGLAAPAGLVSRPRGDGQSLRARDAHGRDRARARRRRRGVPPRRTSTTRACARCLTTVAEKSGWPRRRAPGRALGIACGTEKGSYIATAAEVSNAPRRLHASSGSSVVFECGAIVNPDGLRNQIEGAIVQGLGGALFEAIEFADGQISNGTMARVSRAALQGRPADRDRAARPAGSAVSRRRRDADRLRRACDRKRGARIWDSRAQTTGDVGFLEVPGVPRGAPSEPQFRSVNVTVTIITIAIGCPFNRVGA